MSMEEKLAEREDELRRALLLLERAIDMMDAGPGVDHLRAELAELWDRIEVTTEPTAGPPE